MSVQNLLSPSVHKRDDVGGNRKVIALICPKHGFFRNDHCPQCADGTRESASIHTHDWVRGEWEHIDPNGPIHIESKEHLIRECEKRGVMPRAFMKPRSRGDGFEIARR